MYNTKIGVVVPTIRPELFKNNFLPAWTNLFYKHEVTLYTVYDGDSPKVSRMSFLGRKMEEEFFPNEYEHLNDLIYNYTSAVRNLGIYHAYVDQCDVIITLDDDIEPLDDDIDPIESHIEQLSRRVPISWVSTSDYPHYMRGFPYGIRDEAPVMLSHGIWYGVPDLDAPTQLVLSKDANVMYPEMIIPKGSYFPMSSMNLAWNKAATPYIYQAPMGPKLHKEIGLNLNRFEDIWAGIFLKKDFDNLGWACVTGYSSVYHTRASDVWNNLKSESLGLELNEYMWKDDFEHEYKSLFLKKRSQWISLIQNYEKIDIYNSKE